MTIPSSDCLMSNEENGLLLTPQEEKRIIKELTDAADSNSKEGDLFYVLTNRWWKVWQEYTEPDKISSPIDEHSVNFHRPNGILSKAACKPGRIDNSDLVLDKMDEENEMELRQKLQEGDDYVLVPQDVWTKLLEWYDGGPALPRKLIPLTPKGFVVEVYPLRLQLISANDDTQLVIRISRMETVQELYNKCCEIFSLELGKVRIWDYFRKTKHKLLSDLSQTLEEAQLLMDQEILLEVQVDGVWPHGESNDTYDIDSVGNGLALIPIEPTRSPISIAGGPSLYNGSSTGYGPDLLQANSSNSAFRDTEDGYEVLNPNTKGVSGGLTGLQNLGNTCFMNSAVQCLVHTPQLVEFFLQDYSKEINRHNPLGMDGELAVAFGELLRKLWSPGRAPIAPRAFKAKLARFAPQFSGYNQHDSQELLAFLLDGLHEDLNRVKNKPYIETKDSNGRPDEEVADECWENHKARNDSIIVDVCQGQYKSTLVCPTCSKISVTFDPFMYLSLPLPSTATRSMTITVFYGDGSSLPIPFTITVPKQGCFRDIYLALSTACSLKPHESLLLAEVYESAIYRYLENHYELLSVIRDDDRIVAYRLPKIHNLRRLEILHERKQVSDYQSIGHLKLLGTPLMTFLPESAKTGADIQAAVSTVLAPLLQRKSPAHANIAETRNENGTTMGIDGDTPMENSDPNPSASEDEPLFDIEPEQPHSAEPSFQLCLTDDKGYRRIPIESDTSIPSSSCTKILMGWSERERDLYDFSFLEDLPEVFKPGFTVKKTRQEAVTLFSCLETFLKEEPLGPDDMWYCPSCKEHKQATKKLDLWRLPDILVVHLKRFSYSRYLKNKLDTFVNFPIRDLDLTKYVRYKATSQSHLYELYAVSNHYGGLGGGHYTACVKLLEEDRWYNFDDGHVSPLGEDDVRTSAAYVLFYRRIENDEEPQSDSAP